MSCVAGHQPNLYPYAGFFAKVASADIFVIADNVQYVKKEYHNRNRIRMLDGSVSWLSVPVVNSGHYRQKINETQIDNRQPWARKHEKSLVVNYRKAEFFDQYMFEFRKLLENEWKMLSEYSIAVVKLSLELLGIDTPVMIASELGISGSASGYILDICRKTGCDTYMHGKHAYDYVDFKLLAANGITSVVQEYTAVEYKQLNNPFIPNLSVLDIIFNCGPASREIILAGHRIYQKQA